LAQIRRSTATGLPEGDQRWVNRLARKRPSISQSAPAAARGNKQPHLDNSSEPFYIPAIRTVLTSPV
jgi:hypothetical protein